MDLESIVRDLAALNPVGFFESDLPYCVLCGACEVDGAVDHESSCPWIRAQKVAPRSGE